MKKAVPARVMGDGKSVLVQIQDCPKPDSAVTTFFNTAYCAKAGKDCEYFAGLDGKRVSCSGFEPEPQIIVRDLPVNVQALLAKLCKEGGALGQWVRGELSQIPFNRIITSTLDEDEPITPELKLLDVMVVPERVWQIATAAHYLERNHLRAYTDRVDPDQIMSAYSQATTNT